MAIYVQGVRVDGGGSGSGVETDAAYEVFNVKEFGAVGNGIADDSAAIQAAINAAAASTDSRSVYFPKGNYKVGTQLNVIADGLRLFGEGRESKIIAGGATMKLINVAGGGVGDPVIDITIEGLAFDGQNLDTVDGVYGVYTDAVIVRDCYGKNFGNANDTECTAIHFYDYNDNTTVENNLIEDGVGELNGSDISVFSHGGDNIIKGNRTYSANSQGISGSHNGKADRLLIEGNISKNHVRHGIIAHYETTPTVGHTSTLITGNTCSDNLSTGIYVRAGDSDGFVVSDNLLEYNSGAGPNSGSLAGSISIWGAGKVTVKDNDIYHTGVDSAGTVRTQPGTWGAFNVSALRMINANRGSLVDGNFISYCVGDGIVLYNSIDRTTVKSNHVTDCWKSAISIESTAAENYLYVDKNTIQLSATIADMPAEETPHGIQILSMGGTNKRLDITDNYLYGNGATDTHGIKVTDDFVGRIEGNVTDGWHTGVFVFSIATSNSIGTLLRLDRNKIHNNTDGIRHYINTAAFAFGIENEFKGNTADEKIIWIDAFKRSLELDDRKVYYDSAAPTILTWVAGDKVINDAPAAGGVEGWICTTGGTPGTWKTYGTIQA